MLKMHFFSLDIPLQRARARNIRNRTYNCLHVLDWSMINLHCCCLYTGNYSADSKQPLSMTLFIFFLLIPLLCLWTVRAVRDIGKKRQLTKLLRYRRFFLYFAMHFVLALKPPAKRCSKTDYITCYISMT